MRISTKGRYSLLLLLDLAEHRNEGYIPLKDIAKRQGISKKYLEQLIPMLNGLLRVNRGNHGGYMLAKPSDQCTVGEVLNLTERGLNSVAGLEDEPNHNKLKHHFKTLFIWEGMQSALNDFLNSITLQTIIDRNKDEDMYEYFI